MRDPSFVCPGCGKSQIDVLYTDPPMYRCRVCKAWLIDENEKGIPVLTMEEGRSKRPGLYGLPACGNCGHSPHEGSVPEDPKIRRFASSACKETCRWCIPPPLHVYKFKLGKKWDLP